jgi:hypothetical protein
MYGRRKRVGLIYYLSFLRPGVNIQWKTRELGPISLFFLFQAGSRSWVRTGRNVRWCWLPWVKLRLHAFQHFSPNSTSLSTNSQIPTVSADADYVLNFKFQKSKILSSPTTTNIPTCSTEIDWWMVSWSWELRVERKMMMNEEGFYLAVRDHIDNLRSHGPTSMGWGKACQEFPTVPYTCLLFYADCNIGIGITVH